tara:strand:- start:190 stop:903 length:714 start_codon:yes stop_codon:yes gene_type:complete
MEILKNNKIKVGLVVAAIAAFFIFGGNKAEAQELEQTVKSWDIDVEVGNYEKRIDGGLYGSADVEYVKASSELGVIGGLSLIGSIEQVKADEEELYGTIGTNLSTFIGDIATELYITSIDDVNAYELVSSYAVNLFGIDSLVSVTTEEGGQYTADIAVGTDLDITEHFAIAVGLEYGQSFQYETDYSYTLATIGVQTTLDQLAVFANLNYLNNDLNTAQGTNGEWESTADFGVAFNF